MVVLLADGPLRDRLTERGIRTEVLETDAGGADVAVAAVRLARLLKTIDPDVVLANGIKAATVALPPARVLGVPGVWVRHEDSFAGTLGRLALRLADRTVVVGPPSEQERAVRARAGPAAGARRAAPPGRGGAGARRPRRR